MAEFPILQFGASRFLQAHVDLFVSEALPRGEAMGRIAVGGNDGEPGKPPAHRRLRGGPALSGSGQRPQRRGDRR